MELLQAAKIAIDIQDKIAPFCTNIHIAGSLRRRKPDVGDIEIVCIPQLSEVTQDTLFGDGTKKFQVSKDFSEAVVSLGIVKSGKTSGRMMKIIINHLMPDEIKLDLFMPQPDDFYRQYAIRTGSADYSRHVLAGGWVAAGWCGVPEIGLRRQADCKQVMKGDKKEWVLINDRGQRPPVWKSEEEFFDFINVKWIHPKERNI